ncbi:hypothetical protein [Nonomuraea basaltis]|uniref:hypothetical protein n=1 Tax=Nonomuraea basaltis TaxID=2495887 RepID=UPI00110C6AA6|nr:hypothetical protein [Nonomuraea basaltis]TMR90259.1 hypothetical protein EJK15_56345 [Nonomuraea basaltis]
MRWRRAEVVADDSPLGGPGLTVRVSGEPEPEVAAGPEVRRGRRVAPPLVYDDEEFADPGGCEF